MAKPNRGKQQLMRQKTLQDSLYGLRMIQEKDPCPLFDEKDPWRHMTKKTLKSTIDLSEAYITEKKRQAL